MFADGSEQEDGATARRSRRSRPTSMKRELLVGTKQLEDVPRQIHYGHPSAPFPSGIRPFSCRFPLDLGIGNPSVWTGRLRPFLDSSNVAAGDALSAPVLLSSPLLVGLRIPSSGGRHGAR